MKKIKLEKHISILSGYPFKSELFNTDKEGLPLIRVRDVNSGFAGIYYSGDYPTEYLIRKNDMLIGLDGDFNCVKWDGPEALLNQRVCKIQVISEELSEKYFYYFMPIALSEIHSKTTFTTVKHLSTKTIYDIQIPLPPLQDQIRIAHLLEMVEGLIAKRKEDLAQLDVFLKSVFLDMFGIDDKLNPKWKTVALSSKTEIVSGVTKGKNYQGQKLIEAPYMRVANVQDGHLNLSEIKAIEVSEDEFRRYQLHFNDLLLTEGGDPDKLGRGALWKSEIANCIHQNHIFRVRVLDDDLVPQFLSTLIGSKYGKSYFLKSAKQTTGIASVNSTQLKAFPLVIPPLALQNKFAAIVEKVESLKTQYQLSLTDLESFYGTLSQKAFAGELDLERVKL